MSHKRKYESDRDHDRNVRTRTTESVLPVPEDAAAETVPQVFQYEEVIMNPDSSLLAPAPKPIQKKKKPKAPKVQTEPAGDAALFAQSGGMPVAIDPATGLPINVMPAYGYPGAPGYGQQQQYAYSFSAAPVLRERKKEAKKNKFVRAAGGEVWEDESLASWPKDDFRIFAGNLGNEVTDDGLKRAFFQYKSAVRARVIRDKRTGKSKGYGFVSFLDANDFVRALREMNGKYIGNRPCKLTKSQWADRNVPASALAGQKKK